MATRRSYQDACPIARALDVVGDRWALLVVRELLLGAQRYTDLHQALPGASTNLLVDRLRELTEHGVVRRSRLPPPAATTVYELTDRGRGLTTVLEALGEWGAELPVPSEASTLSATSVLLFLRGCLSASPGPAGACGLELGGRAWTLDPADIDMIRPGWPQHPVAGLRTEPVVLNDLIYTPSALDTARDQRAVEVTGDLDHLRRVLQSASDGAG